MKKEKNILIAFILNLAFSVFELVGGAFTGSVAIISDSVHDLGDAVSIGVSYFLERKSTKPPDGIYTYGYGRYSLLGGFITSSVLLIGSLGVTVSSVERLFNPMTINFDGMLIFAFVGAAVNFTAAFFTRGGESVNQRAVNLHMLEDVLGWIAVFVGAVVMKFTGFVYLDPLMSLGVALFILVGALKNLKQIADVFLERVPDGITVEEVRKRLCAVDGVEEVHHIHIRSFDTVTFFAQLHAVVSAEDKADVKRRIRHELEDMNISHVTVETEAPGERCDFKVCCVDNAHNHEKSCRHNHCHH